MSNQRFNVIFRNVPAERLALLVLAGHEAPKTGRLDHVDPEVQIIGAAPTDATPHEMRMIADAEESVYHKCGALLESIAEQAMLDKHPLGEDLLRVAFLWRGENAGKHLVRCQDGTISIKLSSP